MPLFLGSTFCNFISQSVILSSVEFMHEYVGFFIGLIYLFGFISFLLNLNWVVISRFERIEISLCSYVFLLLFL